MVSLYTDGGARGNPGPAACAFVIKDEKGQVVQSGGEFIGEATNNVAEYKGLILGLTKAHGSVIKVLTCFLDSELVVKQLTGEYRVKDTHLKDLFAHAKLLVEKFEFVEFKAIPRSKNKEADKILNGVLDKNSHLG